MLKARCILAACFIFIGSSDAFSQELKTGHEDWPRWRGPRGDGSWFGPSLPEKWPAAGLKSVWRREIGAGYSGVTVAGSHVILHDRVKSPNERERLHCFHAADGRPIWRVEDPVEYKDLDYGAGPRAAPTVEGNLVYTLGAVGQLNCLRLDDGRRVWSAHLVHDHGGRLPTWGYSASPLVVGELLIVVPGAEPHGGVIALNRFTGREVWRCVPDGAGYTNPILVNSPSGPQLICWTPDNICGVDPRHGAVLWTAPYPVNYGVAIATPIFHDNTVLVCGYWHGSKAIQLGARPREATLRWEENKFLRGLMSQPLHRDGFVYLLDKQFGITCFELATGVKRWDDDNRTTPRGRNPHASMVWLGKSDRCLMLNAEGELILARLTPEKLIEQSRAKIIGSTWAHPAYAGRFAYARSDSELVCVELVAER